MIPILLSIIQGDFGFEWNFTLTDAQSVPVNLTTATALFFDCQLDSDPTVHFTGAMVVTGAATGDCKYIPGANDFKVPGMYTAQIKVNFSTSETVSFSGISVQVDPKIPTV